MLKGKKFDAFTLVLKFGTCVLKYRTYVLKFGT